MNMKISPQDFDTRESDTTSVSSNITVNSSIRKELDDNSNLFENIDVDGDGFIEKEEMINLFTEKGIPSHKIEKLWTKLMDYDINGDDRIDKAEFKRFVDKVCTSSHFAIR